MTASEKSPEPGHPAGGWTFRFICIVFVSYLVIPALLYSLAMLNAPSQIIKNFINATEFTRTGQPMLKTDIDSLFGLLVAVVGVGAAVGSLSSAPLADLLGRKKAIYLSLVSGTAGTLLMALSETAEAWELLFVGRAVIGLATGWGLSLAPTYIMEICQPHMKGAAGQTNQLSQSFAILLSQVIGYEELLGNEKYWNYLLGFPVILFGLQMVLFVLCPESPRYLLLKKEDEEGARKELQKIRGEKDVDADLEQLREEMRQSTTDAQVSVVGLFTTPLLRRPLLIAVAMGLQQNWCGMNGIMFFSNELFEDAGVEGKAARYATSGTGAVFFLGNIIASFLMPHFGRKTLFQMGTFGMGVCSAVLALTMVFKDEVDALKYVNVVVSLMIIAFYALGPICVYWIILGEIFPHSARGAGFSVAILCAFTGFFTHCYALPKMLEAMGSYTFFVFAGIDMLMVVFCFFYMPETKNKSFAEIATQWASPEDLEKQQMDDEHIPYPANQEIVIMTKAEEAALGGGLYPNGVSNGLENGHDMTTPM